VGNPAAVTYGTDLSSSQLDAIAVGPVARTFTVPATTLGYDPGVNIPPAERLSSRRAETGPWRRLPATSAAGNGVVSGCGLVPNADYNTLVGSLDGGASWFVIGAGPSVVSGPGTLLLSVNDCPPASNYGTTTAQ